MRAQESQDRQDPKQRQNRGASAPVDTTARRMLALQRRVGNAALARAFEEERHEHDAGCGHGGKDASVQRSSVLGVLATPGRPVDPVIRGKAERGLNTNLSDVVMHTGPEAERSAAEFGARAYTSGRHIVVGAGGADEHTMLHELAHTWQQQRGPVEGTSSGGVHLSDPSDRHEQEAESIAHRIRNGGSVPAAPPQAAAAAAPAGAVPVARMPRGSGRSRPPASRMHPADAGQLFEFYLDGNREVGRYVRARSNGDEVFDTERFGRVDVAPADILGPRARVGGIHPPGRARPAEERLEGRSTVYLSEADASAARARLRRDPGRADEIGITTFEEHPEDEYQEYQRNSEDLRRLGVPILTNMDLSRPDAAERLRHVDEGANLHFQMPRTGRMKGYSTQKLVGDTNRLPRRMNRDDVSVSITAPDPRQYKSRSTHDSFYGLENRKAVPPGMRVRSGPDPEADLEEYGYSHRISGKDKSAAVASRRKTYYVEADRRSDSPEERGGPSNYREREDDREARSRRRSRSRRRAASRGPSLAPSRADTEYYDDQPRGRQLNRGSLYEEDMAAGVAEPARSRSRRSRSRRRPVEVDPYLDDDLYAPPTPRQRSRSRRRVERSQSRGPATLTQADLDAYVEYGGGADYLAEESRPSRSSRHARSRSRASRHRSRAASQHRNYAAPPVDYDEPVSSQQVYEDEYDAPRMPSRYRSRRRNVIYDSDDDI
ncbi:DUF4157 domain-containing protein [Streptomyces sp. NPDC048417]|uniref:eCIS core domain-containing protein n=1 Tax=Streptomyces sp. NPDC048417 TaxID=3155387 RepID=UPI0034241E35